MATINLRTGVYFTEQQKLIKKILLRASTLVATSNQDPGHIFGWVVWSGPGLFHAELPVAHYIYVKQPFRKLGIARELFKATGVDGPFLFTHTTFIYIKCKATGEDKLGCFGAAKLSPHGIFNPYLLMESK